MLSFSEYKVFATKYSVYEYTTLTFFFNFFISFFDSFGPLSSTAAVNNQLTTFYDTKARTVSMSDS